MSLAVGRAAAQRAERGTERDDRGRREHERHGVGLQSLPRRAGGVGARARDPDEQGGELARRVEQEPGGFQAAKRFVIYTSAAWVLGRSPEPMAEDAPINPVGHVSWRPDHEQLVIEANGERLRTAVVRPGVVYGGGTGIVADLFKSASNGLVRVVGDGNNHWPLVYDRDLADLYAKLAASPDASGIYHANDEGDERVNDIVSAIKPYVPVRPDVRYVPIEEARTKMGAYADARHPAGYVALTLYVAGGAEPDAPLTRTRSGPTASTASVRNETVASGLRYRAGSPSS